MECPFCHEPDTKVIDTRFSQERNTVRRRRECVSCEQRFTTYEKPELTMPALIKNDGRRVKFEEHKLRRGITRALEKRPISMELIENSIDRLKRKLRECGEREVPAQRLGEWVMDELRQLDEVAYVRFASVYRRFQDLEAFQREIKELQKRPASLTEEVETI